MDDSVTWSFEIWNLSNKIWKACTAARTRTHQCWSLQQRCLQLEGYVLAWKTGSCRDDFVQRGSQTMAEMVNCFKRALNLITDCGGENWLQQALVRQHSEQEFRRVVDDLELCVDIMLVLLNRLEAIQAKTLADRCFVREELRESARRDRSDLIERLADLPHDQAVLSEHLLHRLDKCEQVDDHSFVPLRMEYSEVTCGAPIGKGASGTVYRGRWRNHPVAVKVFKHHDVSFEKELEAMSKLVRPHPHVLQMFGYARGPEEQLIVMELMKMDLKKFLERRRISLITAVDIMLQIARGTRYLHEHRVVHRDLKPQNVLVDFDEGEVMIHPGAEFSSVNVLLTDFGISRTEFDTLVNEPLTHLRGTPRYMAPEMLVDVQEPRYSRKVDVYSFAVLCSEILTGSPPFGSENMDLARLKTILSAGRRPQLPENCPDELRELINRCWNADSQKRPTFEEIENELLILKKQLLTPCVNPNSSFNNSSCSNSSSRTSSSLVSLSANPPLSAAAAPPSVEELRITGIVEVGGRLSVEFRPANGTKFCICRWVRTARGVAPEAQKPVMVVTCFSSREEFSELSIMLTAAHFEKRMVLECLPLNGEFRTGRVAKRWTSCVRYRNEEVIQRSWENGQASFRLVRSRARWFDPTGKLFINRKDYYLWWGQGSPNNLRVVFADAGPDESVPLELCVEGDLMCNLRKSDGSWCLIKFTSATHRDNALLTMRHFWLRRDQERSG